MNTVSGLDLSTKDSKCYFIAARLFPNETKLAENYTAQLMSKSDSEIDKLFKKYQFPVLIGDFVEFRGVGGQIQKGQCINHRDNQILLQVDKKDKIGYPHRTDAWAAKSLEPDPNKDLIWIHEKQISDIAPGTLDDRYDIIDRMTITTLETDPKWQEKLRAAANRADNSQNFDEYRNVLQAYLVDNLWAQEIIDMLMAVSDNELSLIFQEAKAWEKSLEAFDKEMTSESLTSQTTDSIVSKIAHEGETQSEEKIVSIHDEVYKHKPETHSISKEKIMSDKPGFLEMVKTDSGDAAYRVGAKQMTKAVKTATSNMLKSKGFKKSQINAIGEFLNTELGEAIISLALGTGLHYAPGISNDPRVHKLAKEFRVEGMAVAGDVVASAAMEYLLPAVAGVIQQLPEEGSKTRVEAGSSATSQVEEEVEEEEVVEAAKPAKARA